MSARLVTIPHAPIERVSHKTGAIEQLEPGSTVNVAAATGIFARVHDALGKSAVIVQLPAYDWKFIVNSDDEAARWAKTLREIAQGG